MSGVRRLFARHPGRHAAHGSASGWGGLARAIKTYTGHPAISPDVPFSADLLPFVRASDIQQGDTPR